MRIASQGRWLRMLALIAALTLMAAACGDDGGENGNGNGDATEAPGEGESGIQSVDDLESGQIVAVQDGTTGELYAKDNLEPNGVKIQSFPEGPDGYSALEACQVDGVINDESTALAEVEARTDLELVETINTEEAYGIAVDPANDALLEAVNITLGEIIEDGTYEEIYGKYADLPPGGNIAETGGEEPPTGEVPDFQTISEGVLTVGSDIPYPPFEFRDKETDELTGFDIDLVNEIASRLGLESEIKDTDFDTIFTQLAASRFDVVIAASTITPEREEEVNFSIPYFNSQQSLTVNPNC